MIPAANKLSRIRYQLGGLPVDAGWYFGWNRRQFKNAKGKRILVYHGVCQKDHLRYNTLFLNVRDFEAQLRFYKRYFSIVSLDEFYHGRLDENKFTIALTFDDGFANNHKFVLPLLEKYEIPATFFITAIREAGYDILWNDVLAIAYRHGPPSFVFQNKKYVKDSGGKYVSASGQYLAELLRSGGFENKAEMIALLGSLRTCAGEDYWLQMTTDQIQELSRSNWVTIGSHSSYHNDLAGLFSEEVGSDLARSKYYLENLTGKEVKALAFPYGSYTEQVVRQAKDCGFTQLLAGSFLFPGDANDPMLRERFTVNPFISNYNQAYANIAGTY